MDRQEKAHWKCVGGNQECVNTPSHFIKLWSSQYFDLRMHAFLLLRRKTKYQSVGYLFVEAYLKPVAAARETAAFPATGLCFLIGLSSHPAALYI